MRSSQIEKSVVWTVRSFAGIHRSLRKAEAGAGLHRKLVEFGHSLTKLSGHTERELALRAEALGERAGGHSGLGANLGQGEVP